MNTNEHLSKIRIKCAEIVGWKKVPLSRLRRLCEDAGLDKQWWYEHQLPRFTESANAALKLVEWMSDKMGKHVELTRTPNLRWIICVSNNGPALHFAADTFPLAVCLCFLKANNIDPETL